MPHVLYSISTVTEASCVVVNQIGQYFGKSNSMMETSLDQFGIHSIIRSDSAFPPQIWGDARGGRTEGIFPAMENFSSIHGHEENGYGVKGRAKKSMAKL